MDNCFDRAKVLAEPLRRRRSAVVHWWNRRTKRLLAALACGATKVVVVLHVTHSELADHLAVARVVFAVLPGCIARWSLATLEHFWSVVTAARVSCGFVRSVPHAAQDTRSKATLPASRCALGPLADLPDASAEIAEALLLILRLN